MKARYFENSYAYRRQSNLLTMTLICANQSMTSDQLPSNITATSSSILFAGKTYFSQGNPYWEFNDAPMRIREDDVYPQTINDRAMAELLHSERSIDRTGSPPTDNSHTQTPFTVTYRHNTILLHLIMHQTLEDPPLMEKTH